jgi:hypothetical protein
VPFCGSENVSFPEPAPNIEARRCFWDAYLAQAPAEFVTVQSTMEGDPIVTIYRVAPGPRLEIFIDNTQDRWGSMKWVRLDCPALAPDSESGAQPAFAPSGECQEIELG